LKYNFNIATINQCTESEGPFKRLAIWFQGCNIQCAECCNPQLFALKQANIISTEELIEIINNAKNEYGIEGITYLGGEPTMQQGLTELSHKIKQLDLGVLLFTGRLFEELQDELVKNVDLIIDGQFKKNKIDNERNLIGSKNQRLICVSNRYDNALDWFYNTRTKQMEINIYEKIIMTGDVIK
jgi:anaerobic ribonucleoside-triphosphate reductase activating protein